MTKQFIKIFVLVFLITLGIIFLYTQGAEDVKEWVKWGGNIDKYGLIDAYSQDKADYPPLILVDLYSSVIISKLFGFEILKSIKISIFLFLLVTSLVFWFYTRSFIYAVALYLSLFLNSVMLGYLDIYFAPTLILSLWALEKQRKAIFLVLFIITFLIKWQTLIISPFILVYILNIKPVKIWKEIDFNNLFLQVILPAVSVLVCVSLIFGFNEIKNAFIIASSHHYVSGLALNLNWIITFILHIIDPKEFHGLLNKTWQMVIKTEQVKITLLPRLIFTIFYFTILYKFFKAEKNFENLLVYSIFGYLAYFMFNIGVHENHLILGVILSLLLLRSNKVHLQLAVVIILICNINMFLFCGFDGSGPIFNRGLWTISVTLSFLNLLLFLYLIDNYFLHFNLLKKLNQSSISTS
jgi:hypothetical protein